MNPNYRIRHLQFMISLICTLFVLIKKNRFMLTTYRSFLVAVVTQECLLQSQLIHQAPSPTLNLFPFSLSFFYPL